MTMSAAAAIPSHAPSSSPPGCVSIEPCRDAAQLREYIDTYWRKGHILARDERLFAFQYQTPWVDRTVFPSGISVLGAYQDGRLLGFLGAIVAPYPRPQSYWLALWHVLPELKGGGQGGKLLNAMQEIAVGKDGRGGIGADGGWIGTFGAGPEALPVYLKRGYACRAVRRWTYSPPSASIATTAVPRSMPMNRAETDAPAEWLAYRYANHPLFAYESRSQSNFRSEKNPWGRVTHCLRLVGSWADDVGEVYEREARIARYEGVPYLMDAWSFDVPGPGWTLAADDVPSVFHPPQPRGNLIYAVGRPFVPTNVQKGECDQDRPN